MPVAANLLFLFLFQSVTQFHVLEHVTELRILTLQQYGNMTYDTSTPRRFAINLIRFLKENESLS